MAVRSSMADLIARVRQMAGDRDPVSPVFADQEIQDVLDGWRLDVRNLPLTPDPTQDGGTVRFLDFFAPAPWAPAGSGHAGDRVGDWELDVVLRDQSFNILPNFATDSVHGYTQDCLVGHWTFPQGNSPGNTGQTPPVYLTGKTYDLNAAAAEVLDRWIGVVKLQFSFASKGGYLRMKEQVENMEKLGCILRSKMRPVTMTAVRTDMAH